jgi:hypothetical protein
MGNYVIDNEQTLNEWVEYYGKHNAFPKKKVPCSVTGEEVTMFGTNLTNRVAKFGGPRELLTNFKCRTAKKADRPTRPARARVQTTVDTSSNVPTAGKKIKKPVNVPIPVPTPEQLVSEGTVSEQVWAETIA